MIPDSQDGTLRTSLDKEMRGLLAQLELVSAIPAKNFDAGHGTDDDPGGRRPPGDYGYRTFAEWYGPPFSDHTGCRNDKERGLCIDAARRELQHLRKGQRLEGESESTDSTHKRMLEETAGWSLQDVALSHWRCNVTVLRRLRVADGRDSETGRLVLPDPATGEDLASRARTLRDNGMTLRAITMALGLRDKVQVQRLLRKAA